MKTDQISLKSFLYQRLVLSPFGLDRESGLVFWMLLFFTTLTFGSLYYFEGNTAVTIAIVYFALVMVTSFLKIELSFYILMAGVMISDQYEIPGFESVTHQIGFFSNLKEIDYIPFFEAGMISPAELHIVLLIISLLIHATIRKDYELARVPVWPAFLFFYGCFVFSFLNGIRSGDLMVALWEVRALLYLALVFLMVPQIIRTKKEITMVIWILIFGISVKAFQGIGRFIELGYTTGGYAVLTNHEDPVFIITMLILLMALLLFNSKSKQKLYLLVLMLPLGLGFYVAQRRASYAALMVSIAMFTFLLTPGMRLKFMKYFTPVIAVVFIYGVVFWNSNSTIGRPVQMVKSGIEKPELTENASDYYSNLYREFENYNLAKTIQRYPVFGTGFGKKYDQPLPLANIRFPLRDYIPHNQILWIFVKMGAIGFFAFWVFFNSFVAKGTQVFLRVNDPYLKAVTAFIVLAVINQMVVSFFDLQLTYYRNMIFLGCIMGLLGPILAITENEDRCESEMEGER